MKDNNQDYQSFKNMIQYSISQFLNKKENQQVSQKVKIVINNIQDSKIIFQNSLLNGKNDQEMHLYNDQQTDLSKKIKFLQQYIQQKKKIIRDIKKETIIGKAQINKKNQKIINVLEINYNLLKQQMKSLTESDKWSNKKERFECQQFDEDNLKQKVKRLERVNDVLRDSIDYLQNDKNQQKKKIRRLQIIKNDLQVMNRKLQTECEEWKRKAEKLKQANNEFWDKNEQLQKERNEYKIKIIRLQHQIFELKQRNQVKYLSQVDQPQIAKKTFQNNQYSQHSYRRI